MNIFLGVLNQLIQNYLWKLKILEPNSACHGSKFRPDWLGTIGLGLFETSPLYCQVRSKLLWDQQICLVPKIAKIKLDLCMKGGDELISIYSYFLPKLGGLVFGGLGEDTWASLKSPPIFYDWIDVNWFYFFNFLFHITINLSSEVA